jgi:hypothetical protein
VTAVAAERATRRGTPRQNRSDARGPDLPGAVANPEPGRHSFRPPPATTAARSPTRTPQPPASYVRGRDQPTPPRAGPLAFLPVLGEMGWADKPSRQRGECGLSARLAAAPKPAIVTISRAIRAAAWRGRRSPPRIGGGANVRPPRYLRGRGRRTPRAQPPPPPDKASATTAAGAQPEVPLIPFMGLWQGQRTESQI